ncbi:nuclear pore complex-interacting protein family member A1-like isoform X8 [Pan paniscus]|uniref:nuclear pore complex-interacting protein family member A1-like isoform X8 n=1 Tax=Pan paniscus TaxID=9597 RepID=UPI003003EE80
MFCCLRYEWLSGGCKPWHSAWVINTLADLRHRGTDFGGSLWLLIITVFLRSYKFAISLRTSYLSVINTLADLRHRGTDFGGSLWLLIITVFLRSYKFAISLRTSYLSVINTLADLRHRGTDFGGSLWLLIITVFLRSYKFAISLRTSYLSVSFLKTLFPSQNGHGGSTDVQQRARRSNHRRQEGIKIVLEAIFTLWRQVKTKVPAKIHKMKVITKVNRHDKINGKRKTTKEHLRKLSTKGREHAEKERQLSEAEENGKLDMKEIQTYKELFERVQALRRRAEDYYKCKIPSSARKPLCNWVSLLVFLAFGHSLPGQDMDTFFSLWLCAQALQREMAERKAAYKHHSPIPLGNRVVQKHLHPHPVGPRSNILSVRGSVFVIANGP